MKQTVFAVLLLVLAGCASSLVLDVASDTLQISTSAAPVCGLEKVALG